MIATSWCIGPGAEFLGKRLRPSSALVMLTVSKVTVSMCGVYLCPQTCPRVIRPPHDFASSLSVLGPLGPPQFSL